MRVVCLHHRYLSPASEDDRVVVAESREAAEQEIAAGSCFFLLGQEEADGMWIRELKRRYPSCRILLIAGEGAMESAFVRAWREDADGLWFLRGHTPGKAAEGLSPFSSELFKDVLSMEYVHDLIYGHIERLNQLKPLFELMDLKLHPRIVLTIVFDNFWSVCENRDNSYRYRLKRILLNQTRKALEGGNAAGIKGIATSLIGTDKVVVVLDCGRREGREAEDYAVECARAIMAHVTKSTEFSVSIGVSDDCATPALLWKAYEQSFRALEDSFRQGNGRVLRYRRADRPPGEIRQPEQERITKELLVALGTHDEEGCVRALDHFTAAAALQNMEASYTKSLAAILLSEAVKYCAHIGLDSRELSEEMICIINDIFKAGTMEEVKKEMQDFLLGLSGKIRTDTESGGNGILDVARAYIEQYYMNPLTLKELADLCGYSTSHFSRSFKECFGIKFIHYLMQVRMEQAKHLLTVSELTEAEISEKTGFQSLSYFCSSFKRETGMTPNRYREERAGKK